MLEKDHKYIWSNYVYGCVSLARFILHPWCHKTCKDDYKFIFNDSVWQIFSDATQTAALYVLWFLLQLKQVLRYRDMIYGYWTERDTTRVFRLHLFPLPWRLLFLTNHLISIWLIKELRTSDSNKDDNVASRLLKQWIILFWDFFDSWAGWHLTFVH